MVHLNLNLATVVLLPALAAAGVTTTMVFSYNNKLFPRLADIIDDPAATTLPGTDVPLTREWTGVGRVDKQLTLLLVFFWQLLDGRHPAATLQAVHFFGQMGAFWTLMQLEAAREGNKTRLIAYTTAFGLLYQNISVAITIPLWALLSLLTQPPPPTSATLTQRLSIHPTTARLLPWAMTLGYILPSLAMAIPSPVQQPLIGLWQAFPLLVALSTHLLRPLFRTPTTPTTPTTAYHAAASTHLFALLLATVPHAAALTLSLTSVFAPATPPSLHPAAVFLPKPSWPGADTPTLPEAALRFMQWDEAVSTCAALVWATTLYVRDAGVKGGARMGVVGVVVRAVGWTVVGGPAAGAVAVVWGRDEVVLGREGQGGTRASAGGGIEDYFLLDMVRVVSADVELSIASPCSMLRRRPISETAA